MSLKTADDLKNYLNDENNLFVAELKWAFFCAALGSYKRDFLLRPFPPEFRDGDTKNFAHLTKTVTNIGCLKSINFNKLSSIETSLLCWVFDERNVFVEKVSKNKFEELTKMAKQQVKSLEPDFIFEIKYPRRKNSAQENNLLYAYHGSQLANFHSILFNGLRSNMNKTSAFGEGTYLSSELNVSLNWSPLASPGGIRSGLGSKLGCVAFCELVDEASGVKHNERTTGVPEKYFLVQNDTLVTIKYLLVYAQRDYSELSHPQMRRVRQVLWKYRFWLMMLTYIVLLAAVGLANSNDFRWYIRRWGSALDEQDFQAYDETG